MTITANTILGMLRILPEMVALKEVAIHLEVVANNTIQVFMTAYQGKLIGKMMKPNTTTASYREVVDGLDVRRISFVVFNVFCLSVQGSNDEQQQHRNIMELTGSEVIKTIFYIK